MPKGTEPFDNFFYAQDNHKFWDMFIIDALIGNHDRHNGNWGFLLNKKNKKLHLLQYMTAVHVKIRKGYIDKMVNEGVSDGGNTQIKVSKTHLYLYCEPYCFEF